MAHVLAAAMQSAGATDLAKSEIIYRGFGNESRAPQAPVLA